MPGSFRVLSLHLTTKPQIMGWSVSGKFSELPNKMGLVMVEELVCDRCPVDRLGEVNAIQNVSETVEACQLFRAAADDLFEPCDEMLLAHAHLLAQHPDR